MNDAKHDPAAGQAMAILGLGQYGVEKVTTGFKMKSENFSVLFGDENEEDSNGSTVETGNVAFDDGYCSISISSMEEYNRLLTLILASRGEVEDYFSRH